MTSSPPSTRPRDLPIDPTTGRPVWRGLPVPWITRWTAETTASIDNVALATIDGIQYLTFGDASRGPNPVLTGRTAVLGQRDELGVLWFPYRDAPGQGEPLFAEIHATRQKTCLLERRCQVCGQPFPDGTPLTFLEPAARLPADRTAPIETENAPCCPTCVPVAMRRCPHQRTAPRVLVTAERARPWAVLADVVDVPDRRTGEVTNTRRVCLSLFTVADRITLRRALGMQLIAKLSRYSVAPVP